MSNLRRMLYLKIARKMGHSASGPVPSIISDGTKIKGNLFSNGTIQIDGRIEGDINCDELIIGVRGNVIGSVTANNLFVYGTLQGTANVNDLVIAKTAKLVGDASHTTIAVEPGAYIDGRCLRRASVKVEQTEVNLQGTHKEPTLS